MKKYKVTLTADERQALLDLLAAGKAAALKLTHARILLKADAADGGPGEQGDHDDDHHDDGELRDRFMPWRRHLVRLRQGGCGRDGACRRGWRGRCGRWRSRRR